jgi:hypothetical protein
MGYKLDADTTNPVSSISLPIIPICPRGPSAAAAGYAAKSYPAVFETEFKRPTPLPAKLQAVVAPAAQPQLQCAVLTGNAEKDVILGRLYSK